MKHPGLSRTLARAAASAGLPVSRVLRVAPIMPGPGEEAHEVGTAQRPLPGFPQPVCLSPGAGLAWVEQ